MKEIVDALCSCTLFNGISKTEIKYILSTKRYQIKDFDKSLIICRTDQYSADIGIIISGCVEVQKILPSGNIICELYKNRGDAFGGAVVFSNSGVYPCDVFSRDKSKILFFHKQDILELCKNPLFAENLISSFANRVLYYEKRLELFSYSSIQKKIAFFLLDEHKTTGNRLIHLPFTKKTWAEYMNVSRPSLCRELKKLRNDNIINTEGNKIAILDQDKLVYLLQQ